MAKTPAPRTTTSRTAARGTPGPAAPSPDATAPEAAGLRERKKVQTAVRIWSTAIALFVERGYDQVSVAEIAAAADVSKMTVFNYFPSKEDLVMRPLEDHVDEAAEVVRARVAGQSALDAVRAHFLAALEKGDPATGLCRDEHILDVVRLIVGTPVLRLRAGAQAVRANELLTDELTAQSPGHDRLMAQVAAAQLLGARRALVLENQRRMMAGESVEAVLPEARANALRAFALVGQGLGDYCAGPPA